MKGAEAQVVVRQVGVQRSFTMSVLRVTPAKLSIVIPIVPTISMVPRVIQVVLHGVQAAVEAVEEGEEDPRLHPVVLCVITTR